MTLKEAMNREQDLQVEMGTVTILGTVDAQCKICGKVTELRADTCVRCADQVETDMVEVWEIDNPDHRWPYKWYSQAFEPGTIPEKLGASSQPLEQRRELGSGARGAGGGRMNHVRCSRCGARCSRNVPGELIVRAWVECPECLSREKPLDACPVCAVPEFTVGKCPLCGNIKFLQVPYPDVPTLSKTDTLSRCDS